MLIKDIDTDQLPNRGDSDKMEVMRIVKANPLTEEHQDEADMTDLEFAQLKRVWNDFRGPVRSTKRFGVLTCLNDEETAFVTYDEDEGLDVGVCDPNDLDLKRFTTVDPVEPRKLELKLKRPNDPCNCGSGKKYKKCCGRIIRS